MTKHYNASNVAVPPCTAPSILRPGSNVDLNLAVVNLPGEHRWVSGYGGAPEIGVISGPAPVSVTLQ